MFHNGQGAPLAPIYHKLIIEDLNLLTKLYFKYWRYIKYYLLGCKDLIGFDTGPGNSIINDLMSKFFNKNFDKDGKIAFKGKILNKLINQIMEDDFFKLSYPKSLDRQYFNHYFKKYKKNIKLMI